MTGIDDIVRWTGVETYENIKIVIKWMKNHSCQPSC